MEFATLDWFSSPSALAVSFAATILGLLIAIFGFRITLQQIRQVKNSQEAAEQAIAGLKVRLSHFNIIQECASAENALNELKSLAKAGDWSQALEVCDRLATALINLRQWGVSLDSTTKQRLFDAESSITKLSSISNIDEKRASVENAKNLATLREVHSTLMKIRFQIHEGQ